MNDPALVAQGIEHWFPKPGVAGSNPAGGTPRSAGHRQDKIAGTEIRPYPAGGTTSPLRRRQAFRERASAYTRYMVREQVKHEGKRGDRKSEPADATSSRSWIVRHPLLSVFLIALVPRLFLVMVNGFFQDFVLDDAMYDHLATKMAEGNISDWDDFTYSLYWRTATFMVPVTGLYKLFGANIIYGQLFVALVGATVAVLVVKIALEFVELRWAIAAGVVIALLPSQAFWSAQLMKDATVWLALTSLALAIAVGNRSTGRRLVVAGIGAAVALAALSFLREHTLVVASWGLLIAAICGIKDQRVPRIAGAAVFCLMIPWFVAGIGPAGADLVTNAGSLGEIRFKMAQGANTAIVDTTPGGTEAELNEVIQERQRVEAEIAEAEEPEDVDQLQLRLDALAARQERIQGGPALDFSESDAALEPDIQHIPRGLSVMLLEPFPVPFNGSASLKLARLESLLWYPLLALGVIGLWRARSNLRALAFPIVAGGGILLMYALTEGNVGTAHRHRGELVWVVTLLAVGGAAHLAARRRAKADRPTHDT